MNCPKCGGFLIGIGASDPESCAVLECDTCDYTRILNDEFTVASKDRGCDPPQGPKS